MIIPPASPAAMGGLGGKRRPVWGLVRIPIEPEVAQIARARQGKADDADGNSDQKDGCSGSAEQDQRSPAHGLAPARAASAYAFTASSCVWADIEG